MNKDIIKGNWKEIKGKLKTQWGELTDDDITKINGEYDILEGMLQKKRGYDRERAKQEIDAFLDENHWH